MQVECVCHACPIVDIVLEIWTQCVSVVDLRFIIIKMYKIV